MRGAIRWSLWGLLVAALGVLGVAAGGALFGWDLEPIAGALAGLVAVVPAAASPRWPSLARAADALLVATITFVALVGIVAGTAAAVILVAGRRPTDDAQWFLGLALVVTLIAAPVYARVRPAMRSWARRVARHDAIEGSDLVRTFAARMTRSVPLEELALQTAEQMRERLGLRAAELWTLRGSVLHPWVGDPQIQRAPVSLGSFEPVVVVQAGLSGRGWLNVWLPELLLGRDDAHVRMAPMAHAGELLGVVVIERPMVAEAFAPQEEGTLVELARQLGVVLHNARLDSALEESLRELRRQAAELQASRGRIVAAGDEARRTIERNLHDGAQQHVVALGIKVKLARTLMDKDPDRAADVLDGLSRAIEDTLQELRDLAHGIYPPLLADRGLAEALQAAGRRAVLPVSVRADGLGRYAPEAEATVYFCVLEALQNAGKYAQDGASVTVDVSETDAGLTFVVADDGAGFDTRQRSIGAGFQNMLDRLGAIGGTLHVASAPGRGTEVTGVLPSIRAGDSSPRSSEAEAAREVERP